MKGILKKVSKFIYSKKVYDYPQIGEFEQEVVGESFYQKNLLRLSGGRQKEGVRVSVKAILYFDDCNKYDSKAIEIRIQNKVVGHLSKDIARQYRQMFSKCDLEEGPLQCEAVILGGKKGNFFGVGKTSFGVWLDLKISKNIFSKLEMSTL